MPLGDRQEWSALNLFSPHLKVKPRELKDGLGVLCGK
jgi:hypothetical protein